MFEDWNEYYFMLGSSAAGLIGLLFVVATLNSSRDASTVQRGAALYLTPTVFNLAVILAVGASAIAPRMSQLVHQLLIAAVALWGLAYSVWVTAGIRTLKAPVPHWTDIWLYGVVPTVGFAGLMAGAVAGSAHAIGAMVLVILMVAVRNAWDLVTWLAPRREG